MLKKFAAASAAVMMLAGASTAVEAATREINLYGASAQYLFWNDAADDFLTSKGCSNVRQGQTSDTKHGITLGDACTGYGNDDVIIRYSAKASYDGIYAMKGTVNTDSCTEGAKYRSMANETTLSGSVVGGKKCVDVTLGASDVAAEAFVQKSSGQVKGPAGGGIVSRDFLANPVDGSGLTTYNPLVVPFAPFLSNDVTLATCDSGADAGEMCDPNNNTCADAATCTAKPVPNVSREMLVNIFSGQAWYWSDFGAGFPAEPITVCLRHAGSGTHATFDLAVMNGNWGGAMIQSESAADPIAWFNDGGSDALKCVNGTNGTTFAIGYADADAHLDPSAATFVTNLYQPKYNGFNPTRVNIRNGLYDWWSAQWLYEDQAEPGYATKHPVVADLVAFAADPTKIPATKAKYWAAQDEMIWFKNSDFSYPGFRGAGNPQTP